MIYIYASVTQKKEVPVLQTKRYNTLCVQYHLISFELLLFALPSLTRGLQAIISSF